MATKDIVFKIKADIGNAPAQIEKVAKAADDASESVTDLDKSFGALKVGLAGVLAGAGIASFIQQSAQLAIANETTAASFTVMLKSGEAAEKMLADLAAFGAATPFQLPELEQSARTLLSFGVAGDQILPTLKSIGDVAAGTQQPITELAAIFGKARAAGRVMTEDLNQLAERGIPVYDLFAKQFGITTDEVRKFAETGRISFANLEQAFTDVTSEGGLFFNMMKTQSETTAGAISNMEDATAGFMREIGRVFTPIIKGVAQAVTPLINFAKDVAGAFANWVTGANSAANATTALERATFDASQQVAAERAQLNLLVITARDETKSKEERTAAVKELNRLSPEYLGNLTLETINTEAARKALSAYNDELLRRVRSQVYFAELTKLETEIAKLESATFKNQTDVRAELDNYIANNLDFVNSRLGTSAQTLADLSNTQLEAARSLAKNQVFNYADPIQEDKLNKLLIEREQLLRYINDAAIQAPEKGAVSAVIDGKSGNAKKTIEETLTTLAMLQKAFDDLNAKVLGYINAGNLEALPREVYNAWVSAAEALDSYKENLERLERNPVEVEILTPKTGEQIEQAKTDIETLGKAVQDVAEETGVAWQDTYQQIADGVQGITSTIVSGTNQLLQGSITLQDQLIKKQQERVDEATALAQQGNVAQLEAERQRLDALQAQRAKFVKQQQDLALLELALNSALTISNSLVAASKAGAQGGIAAPLTIASTLAALGIGFAVARQQAQIAASGFKDGGFTGNGQSDDVAGVVHKNEFVHTAETTRKYRPIFEAIHRGRTPVEAVLGDAIGSGGGKQLLEAINKTNTLLSKQGASVTLDEQGFSIFASRVLEKRKRANSR